MSGNIQCPSCKEQIDDDSRYCDQCGEQILICSVCGRTGKGKRCIFDGKEMIPAGSAGQQSAQTAQINQPSPVPASASAGDKIKLSSHSHEINIEVPDGGIIGRKNGPFAGVFSGFPHVSGTHCKFLKTDGMWYVQDMGSTNGTFLNNNRLDPNIPVLLQNDAKIKVADVELSINFGTSGGTVRV